MGLQDLIKKYDNGGFSKTGWFQLKDDGDSAVVRLLHKGEIHKLLGKTKEKGVAIVPLKVYFKGSLVKVEVGLAKGKKLYDKRDDIAKKDQKREAEREFKVRNFG